MYRIIDVKQISFSKFSKSRLVLPNPHLQYDHDADAVVTNWFTSFLKPWRRDGRGSDDDEELRILIYFEGM